MDPTIWKDGERDQDAAEKVYNGGSGRHREGLRA
jgi:hypothetical protein